MADNQASFLRDFETDLRLTYICLTFKKLNGCKTAICGVWGGSPVWHSCPPDCPAVRVRKSLFDKGGMCGDEADVRERIRHAGSVSLMLVNTAVYMCDNIAAYLAAILWYGDGDER